MRNLMRVTVVCMAVCIGLMLYKPDQVVKSDADADEIAMLINGYGDTASESPKESKRLVKDPDLALFEDIVANEMLRLNLLEGGFKNTYQRTRRFIEFVKLIESNGNRYAKASTSSAMSLFQFTIPSIPTALNRLENYMERNYLGELPKWAVELRGDPTLLYDVSETRQAILAFVNIIEQRGSDELLIRFFSGERSAAKAIYYAHHHTDPDQATLRRTELIFAKIFK